MGRRAQRNRKMCTRMGITRAVIGVEKVDLEQHLDDQIKYVRGHIKLRGTIRKGLHQ